MRRTKDRDPSGGDGGARRAEIPHRRPCRGILRQPRVDRLRERSGSRRSVRTGGGGEPPSRRPAPGDRRVAAANSTHARPNASVASLNAAPATCSGDR